MDFLKDQSGRHLLRLSQLADVPDFVKQSSVAEEDARGLPDTAFADALHREFPIDSPGHVWLGIGYCKSAGITDPGILSSLRKAASIYNIDDSVRSMEQQLDADAAPAIKKASNDDLRDCFAVVIDFGAGGVKTASSSANGVRGFYPMTTESLLKESSRKLIEDMHRLPIEIVAEGCRALYKKAGDMQVRLEDLPWQVGLYGEPKYPALPLLKAAAEQRVKVTGDVAYDDIYASCAQNWAQRPAHEWAELWLQADRLNNYKQASDELDVFRMFNAGPSVASINEELDKWALFNGIPVPVEKVASVQEETLRKHFRKTTADQLLDLVDTAKTKSAQELTERGAGVDRVIMSMFVRLLTEV